MHFPEAQTPAPSNRKAMNPRSLCFQKPLAWSPQIADKQLPEYLVTRGNQQWEPMIFSGF